MNATSARFALRTATAEAHERLDRLFSRFDLSDRGGYREFLTAQAGAFLVVEAALDRAGAGEILPDWDDRKRSHALTEDVRALSIAANEVVAPTFKTEAEILGGVYVLEGSRLGGAMLLRRVPAGMPTAFLSPGAPSAWRALVSVLDERLNSPTALNEAVGAATSVFHAFETSANRILGAFHS